MKLYYRLKYRIIRCIQQIQFYYEILKYPILVKYPPIATTVGKNHKLQSIEFTPKGANLYFYPICVHESIAINFSNICLSGQIYTFEFEDIFMESGDTFSPTWGLELKQL